MATVVKRPEGYRIAAHFVTANAWRVAALKNKDRMSKVRFFNSMIYNA